MRIPDLRGVAALLLTVTGVTAFTPAVRAAGTAGQAATILRSADLTLRKANTYHFSSHALETSNGVQRMTNREAGWVSIKRRFVYTAGETYPGSDGEAVQLGTLVATRPSKGHWRCFHLPVNQSQLDPFHLVHRRVELSLQSGRWHGEKVWILTGRVINRNPTSLKTLIAVYDVSTAGHLLLHDDVTVRTVYTPKKGKTTTLLSTSSQDITGIGTRVKLLTPQCGKRSR